MNCCSVAPLKRQRRIATRSHTKTSSQSPLERQPWPIGGPKKIAAGSRGQENDDDDEEEEEAAAAEKKKAGDVIAERCHPVAEDVEGALSSIMETMPLQKVIALQVVSRLWRTFLTSDVFLRAWEQKHSRMVVMARKTRLGRELLAYDAASRTWMSLSGGRLLDGVALRELLGGEGCRNVVNGWGTTERLLVAGSTDVRGLLCFAVNGNGGGGGGGVDIVVVNPLTGRHTRLPPTPFELNPLLDCFSSPNFSLHLHADNNGHYLVSLFYPHRFSLCRLLIYTSRSRSWRCSPSVLSFHTTSPAAFLHLLHQTDLLYFHGRTNILAYDSTHSCWEALAGPYSGMPTAFTWMDIATGGVAVFRHQRGRLLVAVAKVIPSPAPCESDVLQGFSVFEFRSSSNGRTSEWTEIAWTPEHLWRKFDSCSGETCCSYRMQFHFVYAGGLVLMTLVHANSVYPYDDESVHRTGCPPPPLAYDIDADSWHHLPPPPPPPGSYEKRKRKRKIVGAAREFMHSPYAVCSMSPSFSATPTPSS